MVCKLTKSSLAYFNSRKNSKKDGVQPERLKTHFKQLDIGDRYIAIDLISMLPADRAFQFNVLKTLAQ